MNKVGIDSFKIFNFDTLDSTSTYLKKHYFELDDLTLVFAKEQTQGHGRMQRKWVSSNGDSLLFSILFKDKKVFENFDSLSLLSASKIYKFLSNYVDNVSIKWPNDVYINNKKVCGILMESVSLEDGIQALVLGIGININNEQFPDDLSHKATSLFLEKNTKFSLKEMQIKILPFLYEIVEDLYTDNKGYLDVIKTHNYLKGKIVESIIENSPTKVTVIDINNDNTLLVKKDEELMSLSVGEVLPIN
jgi:BirA family biotin operon repressor/biotin-[acetyl-CoA-carboxylase] ligase